MVLIATQSCVSLQAEDRVCKKNNISYTPLIEVGKKITIKITDELNITNQINKLKKYGNIFIYLESAQFIANEGDFKWASYITISFSSNNKEIFLYGKKINTDLKYEKFEFDNTVDLGQFLNDEKSYLIYRVSGTIPEYPLNVDTEICFNIKSSTEKTISDLE